MINQYTISLLFLIMHCTYLSGQREMQITEMNSDNDAVLEIVSEDPTASDYTLMTLGFNQSNQAWLRTRTDHDLSFFTNDSKRFIITKDGQLQYRTRTLGLDGTQRANFDFFTGSSNYRGGITYCDCPADGGDLMSFNMDDDGYFSFRSNGETRMFLDRDNSVRFGGLEGSNTRALYVEEDGTLTTEASSFYVNVGPAQFQPNSLSTSEGELEYRTNTLSADFFFAQDGPVFANAHPSIPYTRYRITEIKIEYLDNSTESLEVFFESDVNGTLGSFSSTGQLSGIRTATLNADILIDNEATRGISISAHFNDEVGMFLYNIKLKCTPVN